MSDHSLWDSPLYELALGDTMRRYGLAINDTYRLWEWRSIERLVNGSV